MAASYGEAVFLGNSGRIYCKDLYADDTAGNKVRWDNGSGAGAATFEYLKFNEPVRMIDFVLAAATGQTKTQFQMNNVATGDICRNSLHLASVTFRPRLNIPFVAGSEIGAVQLA